MKTIAKSAVKAIAVVFAVLALFAGFLFANSRGRMRTMPKTSDVRITTKN